MKKFELILCIVNAGFSQNVMEAARAAGARGGTIIRGRGSANPEAEEFFSITIQPDKEIVMLLVPAEIKDDVLRAMQSDADMELKTLKIDGGASANDFLAQFQSDISHVPVDRPRCVETTALGASYLAGLAVGFWKSTDEIRRNRISDRLFAPSMEEGRREDLLQAWHRAVSQCQS